MNQQIVDALKGVMDPELGLDIVTLGFVRGAEVDESGTVRLKMTLTTPLCPLKDRIEQDVRQTLAAAGHSQSEIEYVFDPPWEPPPEAKAILGI